MNHTTFRFRPLLGVLAALAIPVAGCGTTTANGPAATTGPSTGPTTTSAPEPGPTRAGTTSTPKANCPRGWNSLPKASNRASDGSLTGVQAGRHECYDRLVFRLSGRAPGYRVEYVNVVSEDGSGNPVPLRGGARISVIVRNPAYDVNTGKPTYRPANERELVDARGYRTFRQVAWAGSFEGQSTIGLGVRAKLPFRVLTLTGPGSGSRLVVDVAHTW